MSNDTEKKDVWFNEEAPKTLGKSPEGLFVNKDVFFHETKSANVFDDPNIRLRINNLVGLLQHSGYNDIHNFRQLISKPLLNVADLIDDFQRSMKDGRMLCTINGTVGATHNNSGMLHAIPDTYHEYKERVYVVRDEEVAFVLDHNYRNNTFELKDKQETGKYVKLGLSDTQNKVKDIIYKNAGAKLSEIRHLELNMIDGHVLIELWQKGRLLDTYYKITLDLHRKEKAKQHRELIATYDIDGTIQEKLKNGFNFLANRLSRHGYKNTLTAKQKETETALQL